MADGVDKIVISHRGALGAKYGSAGVAKIYEALGRLVAADRQRGLATIVMDVDDPAHMNRVGGEAVEGLEDQSATKAAVDAIATAFRPDYLLLLDGPDVIPHISLIPMRGLSDGDKTIESDLPYACEAGFSRDATHFLAVTRVVGRLPAAPGENNPAGLITLIDASVAHKPRPASDYKDYFAISAEVWHVSTQLSLNAVFGDSGKLFVCPEDSHPRIDKALRNRAHFINCHGGSGGTYFSGQRGATYPVAINNEMLLKLPMADGVVAAVECCYGAQLYDYRALGNAGPICLRYMAAGAIGYAGSTNVAYGPEDSNGMADLFCQFFLKKAINGASLGRAFLQARQDFIESQTMANPTNLKTVTQYILLGDPSLQAVATPQPASTIVSTASFAQKADFAMRDSKMLRQDRRSAMLGSGHHVSTFATKLGKPATNPLDAVKRFQELARQRGFGSPVELFEVTGGRPSNTFGAGLGGAPEKRQLAIVVEKGPGFSMPQGPQNPTFKVMVGHVRENGQLTIETCVSR